MTRRVTLTLTSSRKVLPNINICHVIRQHDSLVSVANETLNQWLHPNALPNTEPCTLKDHHQSAKQELHSCQLSPLMG